MSGHKAVICRCKAHPRMGQRPMATTLAREMTRQYQWKALRRRGNERSPKEDSGTIGLLGRGGLRVRGGGLFAGGFVVEEFAAEERA